VLRGHELPDTETIVDTGEGYFVVEKDEPVKSVLEGRRRP
jgi:hypothetical protein